MAKQATALTIFFAKLCDVGFTGEQDIKYADVVLGGESMTMVVRISGGVNALIEIPFIIFMNKDRNYPIRGVPDDIPGVPYRSGPKGWMNRTVFPQWLNKKRIIQPLPSGRQRLLYLDNCSGHAYTEDVINSLFSVRTKLLFFPPNSTHLVQPCDSFIIHKIKRAWTTRWDHYKMEKIKEGSWKDKSGRSANPRKTFFLRLASLDVQVVNKQRDGRGLTYARNAMIMTGMALKTNGRWEVTQLTPQLQNLIQKHKEFFDGKSPVLSDGCDRGLSVGMHHQYSDCRDPILGVKI